MTVDDLFTSDRQGREAHRTEAARLRALAADATTDTMRKHLEDRAREHVRLAGTKVALLPNQPTSRRTNPRPSRH
jgi:hypothetical protein